MWISVFRGSDVFWPCLALFDPGWPIRYSRKRINSQNCVKFWRKRYSDEKTHKITNFQQWNGVSCMQGSFFTLPCCLTLFECFRPPLTPRVTPKRFKHLKLWKSSTWNDVLMTKHTDVQIFSCELAFSGCLIFFYPVWLFFDPCRPLICPWKGAKNQNYEKNYGSHDLKLTTLPILPLRVGSLEA